MTDLLFGIGREETKRNKSKRNSFWISRFKTGVLLRLLLFITIGWLGSGITMYLVVNGYILEDSSELPFSGGSIANASTIFTVALAVLYSVGISNLRSIYTEIAVNFPQSLSTFCCGFSTFLENNELLREKLVDNSETRNRSIYPLDIVTEIRILQHIYVDVFASFFRNDSGCFFENNRLPLFDFETVRTHFENYPGSEFLSLEFRTYKTKISKKSANDPIAIIHDMIQRRIFVLNGQFKNAPSVPFIINNNNAQILSYRNTRFHRASVISTPEIRFLILFALMLYVSVYVPLDSWNYFGLKLGTLVYCTVVLSVNFLWLSLYTFVTELQRPFYENNLYLFFGTDFSREMIIMHDTIETYFSSLSSILRATYSGESLTHEKNNSLSRFSEDYHPCKINSLRKTQSFSQKIYI